METGKPYYPFQSKKDRPTTFYHATIRLMAVAILMEGLKPLAVRRGGIASRESFDDRDEYVYVFQHRRSAEEHAAMLRQLDFVDGLQDPTILTLTLPDEIVQRLELDLASDSPCYSEMGHMFKGVIPPEFIHSDDPRFDCVMQRRQQQYEKERSAVDSDISGTSDQ